MREYKNPHVGFLQVATWHNLFLPYLSTTNLHRYLNIKKKKNLHK